MPWAEADAAETVRGLTPAQRNVLRFIAARADSDMMMFWGQDRMAHYLDMSRRSVVTAMQVLEERGLIRKETRGWQDDDGQPHRSSNKTHLQVDAVLAQALPEAVEKYWKLVAPKSENPSAEERNSRAESRERTAQSNRPSNTPKKRQASPPSPTSPGEPVPDAMPVDPEEEEDMWSVPYVEPEAYSFVG